MPSGPAIATMLPETIGNETTPMKTWILAVAFLLLAVAADLRAETSKPAQDQSNATAPSDAQRSELEEKYAKEAREKITTETVRVEQSMDALYWGLTSFVSIAAILGIFALLKTQKQSKELERLRAEIESSK